MKAWHFLRTDTKGNWSTGSGGKGGSGVIVKPGQVLKVDGDLEMCARGLHASTDVMDALYYSPGYIITRVDCRGEVIGGDDKLVCSERECLWGIDGEVLLWRFARACALDVIDLWDAPDVVVRYLKTGDEDIRAAAWDAAWAAARDAAWDAAWAAARAAARAAAWDAARAAARDAEKLWQARRLSFLCFIGERASFLLREGKCPYDAKDWQCELDYELE